MKKTAICILHPGGSSDPLDLEIPLNLPAEELIGALRRTFLPELREGEPESGFLRCENPIALLHGRRKLKDWGVRDGTILYLQ